jgi:hypothetical protein
VLGGGFVYVSVGEDGLRGFIEPVLSARDVEAPARGSGSGRLYGAKTLVKQAVTSCRCGEGGGRG